MNSGYQETGSGHVVKSPTVPVHKNWDYTTWSGATDNKNWDQATWSGVPDYKSWDQGQATWSGFPDHMNWDQATWSVLDYKIFDITIKTISFQPFSADFSLLY